MHSAGKIREAFGRTALRLTPQRYALLDDLLHRHDHPTAEQIRRAINARDPRSSRATVYNNLNSLIRAGLVKEVVIAAGPVRYDANLDPHHHFLCEQCGAIEDIGAVRLPRLLDWTGFDDRIIRDFQIVFRGFCRQCSVHNREGETHGKSRQTGSGTGGRQRRRAAG